MKVVLTGASGYVGGVLLRALRDSGHETQAWSRRECSPPWTYYDLKSDPASLPWSQCDAIVHAAYDFKASGTEQNLSRNIRPSLAILRAARDAGVSKLIYISSFSAFEGTRSDYGKAKLAVEKECLALGGTVIRPGLVWGDQSGGVMGALEQVVNRAPLVPCLVGPRGLPQYLVHEEDLARVVVDEVNGNPTPCGCLIEAAHPIPLPLRQILVRLKTRNNLIRAFVPIPWQFAMISLRTLEFVGLNPPFRSDSLTGLVHGTPALQSKPKRLHGQFREFA